MPRSTTLFALLLLAPLIASACGSDDPIDTGTEPTPISITEPFSGNLNPNGSRTHPFSVARAGTVTARITALAPDDTLGVGLDLGTWNGSTCAVIIRNSNASLTANSSATGTAQQTGQFCVSIYDIGKLTASTDYTIDVTHY